MIGIGIDTGGTCTDAVVFDSVSRKVLAYGKTLTTKKNLKEGILKALLAMDQNLVQQAEYISLSTTLATNACVENKGGRAKLVFIGLKQEYVEKMQGTYGLPPTSEIYFLAGTPTRFAEPGNAPDWDMFRNDVRSEFKVYDSVAVVQINPRYNNGEFEKTAETIIKEELGIPCVCGYDLFQEINVQRRGATALLNARLLPIMNEFFASIDQSIKELGLDVPVQVVKSDGTIMSREYAMERPVETLLCGPAASIIGATELSKRKDALIVDMGGTTSDVAMVKGGIPVTSGAGISIGSWKTMVKGVAIDTFALGGDSAVGYKDGELFLEERRVVPLCMIGSQYPYVVDKLKKLVSEKAAYSYPANQFLMLASTPENEDKFSPSEYKLIEALNNGPLIIDDAAEAIGVSPYVLKTKRLEDEGVIIRCGVTPTDAMHILGDYTDHCVEASKLGMEYLRIVTRKTIAELCTEIYEMVKERLYHHLVRIFMKHEMGDALTEEDQMSLGKVVDYVFQAKRKNMSHSHLYPQFKAATGFIGIGAPTSIFMKDVADLLEVDGDFPDYGKVANAIGAAVGSISTEYIVRIEPCHHMDWSGNYVVSGGEKLESFEYYDQAIDAAKRIADERVREKADAQGAGTNVIVELEIQEDSYDLVKDGAKLFIETRVIGRATAQ
ncbi:N-methylhydantoinase A/oxoprolinase/acetone carboxylase beta subunit [Clostridiales Family XIII bacterium PM5-7]